MIDMLTNEIEKALKNNLYLVALNTALTLPDICGKAEFPNKSTTKRYIEWFDKYIGQYETTNKNNLPYLSGEVVYSLRCSLLHQGNPNIEEGKGNIDEFILNIQKENIGIYIDTSSVITHADGTATRSYDVNVRGICFKLCSVAKNYYKNNRSKFNFFNYKIKDLDKAFDMVKPFILPYFESDNNNF